MKVELKIEVEHLFKMQFDLYILSCTSKQQTYILHLRRGVLTRSISLDF